MPLDRGQAESLLPLVGLEDLSVLFLWDGRQARCLAAETPVGSWYEA